MNADVVRLARMAACLALLAACSAEPPPGPKTALTLKDLMEHVIDPAADVFWASSGTIITAQGETSRTPTTEAGWEAAVNAAATVLEGGNLLAMPGRARDQKEWLLYAQELSDAAAAGMKAAQTKDAKGVFDTGGRIYLACRSCHMKYMLGYP